MTDYEDNAAAVKDTDDKDIKDITDVNKTDADRTDADLKINSKSATEDKEDKTIISAIMLI